MAYEIEVNVTGKKWERQYGTYSVAGFGSDENAKAAAEVDVKRLQDFGYSARVVTV